MLKTFHKFFAKRGRVVRGFTEVYLRDDIPCGLSRCESCQEATAGGSASLCCLQPAPALGSILVLDTNVVLHQLDVLEGARGLADVVVLQTVLEEVRHRSPGAHARLLALLHSPERRFFPFSNVHHRDTASPRASGESPNDYNDRLVRRAAAWLAAHFAASGGPAVTLVTNDAACSAAASKEGLPVCTLRELVTGRLAQAQPALLELLAASQERWGLALEEQAILDTASSSASVKSSGSSSSSSVATAPRKAAAGGPLRYPEHLTGPALDKGLRERSLFKGTLRVNRECWFEARVMIHNVLGKGGAVSSSSSSSSSSGAASAGLTGGDDSLPLLLLGREALNRAMDGDTVIVELLPRAQWKRPSTVLAGQGASALEDDDAERSLGVQGSGGQGDSSSSSSSGESRLTPLQEALAAVEGGRGKGEGGRRGAGGLEPTARVVAIATRAWRPLCGSLEPLPSEMLGAGAGAGAGASSPAPAAASAPGAVETALFVPWDSRFPRVRIETRQRAALSDKRLVVTLDDWPSSSKYPRGHYTRTLGVIGEREAENACIAHEFDIAVRAFSPAVLACLPPPNYCLGEAEAAAEVAAGRVDLRATVPGLCSIDPPGCKDIDDALHAVELAAAGAGRRRRVQVGVHIADVGHFVKQGSAIDVEAALRANTTYLVEKRLDMLPGLLTADLCSLKGGVDRLAFSVTWEFEHIGGEGEGEEGGMEVEGTGAAAAAAAAAAGAGAASSASSASSAGEVDDATIQAAAAAESTGAPPLAPLSRLLPQADHWRVVPGATRFFRSLIHSRAALTYAAAQALLDAPPSAPPATPAMGPVAASVRLLASIARSLRASRLAAGALALSSPEVKFLLDSETHDPLDVTSYVTHETNSTVEEFMLLANCAVAARVTESFPRVALLRRHPAPPPSNFDALTAAARAAGITLDCSSNKALAESLDAAEATLRASSSSSSSSFSHTPKLLRILATRCMMQATYFPSGTLPPPAYAHYGLASPLYTHFTSPIRRYADVIVHRLLAAAIGLEPLPPAYTQRGALGALADNCNRRHLASQLAGRASGALHTHLYFRGRCVVETGLVIRLKANGCVVLVPRYGIEALVLLGKREDGSARGLVHSAEAQTLGEVGGEGGAGGQPLSLRIFDAVKVALYITERVRGRRELAMRLLQPAFHSMPSREQLGEGVAVEDHTLGGEEGGGGAGGGGKRGGAAGAGAGAAAATAGGKRKREGKNA